jgi:hypothetical protein
MIYYAFIFVGFTLGVFCMSIFSIRSYEKGRKDAVLQVNKNENTRQSV